MTVDVQGGQALLKLLGEPVRWSIVQRLATEELCVCHLVEDLGLPQPLVSHHLRALRTAGVLRTEPCGSFTYYIVERAVLAGLADDIGALATEPNAPRRRPCS